MSRRNWNDSPAKLQPEQNRLAAFGTTHQRSLDERDSDRSRNTDEHLFPGPEALLKATLGPLTTTVASTVKKTLPLGYQISALIANYKQG